MKKNAEFKGEEEIRKLFENDCFNRSLDEDHGALRSQYKSFEYSKTNMKYMEPKEIQLNSLYPDDVFYYIPLKQSLKNLLSDDSVKA